MIHYKQKKKDYISPEIDVLEYGGSMLCDISATGHDQPWDAKAAGPVNFGSDFDDDFENQEYDDEVYEAYGVEW